MLELRRQLGGGLHELAHLGKQALHLLSRS